MFGTIAAIAGWIFIIALLVGAGIVGLELLWYRIPVRRADQNDACAKKNIVVVTGASSGLGRMCACLIYEKLKNIDEIWLVARRQDKLLETAELVSGTTRCICCDLTDADDMIAFKNLLKDESVRIRMLFNCAGKGLIGDHNSLTEEDQTQMTQLNCIAAVKIVDMCLPYMQAGDRIINVCSTAGFQPLHKLGVYSATKSFMLKYTRSLRMELLPKKIMVTAVCPYWIKDTEFIPSAVSKDKGVKYFPIASDVYSVGKLSLTGAMIGFPVVTPGIVCTIHRFFSKLLSDTVLVYIWEGIRRI